jgi:hypothetical protein
VANPKVSSVISIQYVDMIHMHEKFKRTTKYNNQPYMSRDKQENSIQNSYIGYIFNVGASICRL